MDTPLLVTKLFIPEPRPGLVARPRLVERLNEALSSGLVLVSAPAGFGKTTAVVQWAHYLRKNIPVAWISLDEGDNDPVRFWDYFIAALKTFKPAAGEAASSVLHSSQSYTIEAVLTSLINEVTDIPNDFVIVLDDYHLIKSDAVHAALAFLLDHLPHTMHLVIATRSDPLLPLPHLRGRGALVEVNADDLRFTDEEAARLLKEMLGAALSVEQVASLNTHTEGWVGGLKMAALSMRGQKDIQSFISGFTGSHRYIMDYLVEEVLKRQNEDLRNFLLKTSVLEKMTAPLCDLLTGSSESRDTLNELDRANLFLIPLDNARQWYRYHHLFAELLRHQLEATQGAEEVTRLHRIASQWYEENKHADDAIRHALAARNWERSMKLIGAESESRLKRGEWNTLLSWFQAIPDEVLKSNFPLYNHYASVLTELGPLESAESALSYLEKTAGDDSARQGEVAFFRSLLAHRKGDDTERLESAERALALLPPDRLSQRAWVGCFLGIVKFDTGQIREAQVVLTDAYETARLVGDHWISAVALAHLSGIVWLRGELHRATMLMQRGIELVGNTPGAAIPTSWIGLVKYEQNDLEEAARDLQLANKLNELGGQADNPIHNYFYLAEIHRVRGDIAAAKAVMAESDKLLSHSPTIEKYRAVHMAYHILFALHQNDLDDAVSWGQRLSEHACTPWVAQLWVPARLLIARGEKSAASAQLDDLCKMAIEESAHGLVIWIRVCQALAAPSPDEALTFLADALRKGESEGFIRTFVDEGKLLKPLLRQALSQGITPEYTAKLLNIIEAEERLRQAGSGADVSHETFGILSDRELEILRLVATGISNAQIAGRLVISPGTAKKHVHNIFQKLNAKDRLQAVNRARELKLI
jgi:LuxR family transcriptional regulator, maltose regulon positive regulatory protein